MADGASTSTITIQLRDENDNELTSGGDDVTLSTTAGSLGEVSDNGDGTYTATLTSSTTAETATITGTVNGADIEDDATVEFTTGSASAAASTIQGSRTSIVAGGASTSKARHRRPRPPSEPPIETPPSRPHRADGSEAESYFP